MSEWNPINISDSDHNHEMSEINEQMKNKSCRNNVNKKCEHEKVRKCEHECEKNRKQRQNEKHECEHKERDSSVNINDNDKKSKSCQSSLFTQLTLLVYSVNSQHTAVSEFCTVSQITWAKNFSDSESETINTWEEMAFYCNSETCHLSDWIKTLLQSFNLHFLTTLMMMCNFIHSVLLKNQVYEHHEMLMMNKLEITETDSSTAMLQMLDSVIKAIAVLHLSNADTENSV